jgi:hypothetical protein
MQLCAYLGTSSGTVKHFDINYNFIQHLTTGTRNHQGSETRHWDIDESKGPLILPVVTILLGTKELPLYLDILYVGVVDVEFLGPA